MIDNSKCKTKKNFLALFLLFICSSISSAKAEEIILWDEVRLDGLDRTKSYKISSGTGFFVSDNIIATSQHVVTNCANIAIRGAVNPGKAKLIHENKEDDLALLQSESSSPALPRLRQNYSSIKQGDIIFTIGYPLDRSDSGLYILKEAKVINVKQGLNSPFSEIEFTDSVNHGNSGGPLLDANGNIIGVVKAKGSYINTQTREEKIVGIGVGLDSLMAFLDKNKVNYSRTSSYDILTNYRNDQNAQKYIVNIHCVHE